MKRITVVYVSAATETDERLRHELEKHLRPLEQQGLMEGWHAQQIPAGSVEAESREVAFNKASLILLLISADFHADASCQEWMQRALERQRRGEVQVLPILLRRVDGKGALFVHLKALPANGKPIASWPNKDDALAEVAEGIRRVIEGMQFSEASSLDKSEGDATLVSFSPSPYEPPLRPKGRKRLGSNLGMRGVVVLLAVVVILAMMGGILYFKVDNHRGPNDQAIATATATTTAYTCAFSGAKASPIDATMGSLKFNEALTRNCNAGWGDPTSGACNFAADGYHVISQPQAPAEQRCIARKLDNFSDFTFQVQMNLSKGTGGGLLFRRTDSFAYYFRLNKDGHYALLACRATPCQKMLVNNTSSYYDPHNQMNNTLTVLARGRHIELFVNHVRIDQVDDSESLQGQIGLVAEPGSEIVFRQAQVWTSTPPLFTRDNTLHMIWKGIGGDQHIYWASFDGTTWSPQQRLSDTQTSYTPALAMFQNKLFMVWEGDQGMYWASFDFERASWSAPQRIYNAQTGYAPALAVFQNRLFMVWRGVEADSIFWTSSDGTTWSPQLLKVPGVRTSHAPALMVFQNRLFMTWKGIEGDPHIWWASFDGTTWSPQQYVPGAEASSTPTLTIFQNRLFTAWKGNNEDPGIYWASFDGRAWSAQQHVLGPGTDSAPALAIFQNRLFMAWKQYRDSGIYWASFDGRTWLDQSLQIPLVGTNVTPTLATF